MTADFDSSSYWERRYARGRDSGAGSRGELARFKADYLNGFVLARQIGSVIEFGCGDGQQLALASYPRYVGLDVAPTAVARCIERFTGDRSKSFFLYSGAHFHDGAQVLEAELALSLDVIYHLVEDDVFERYMHHLFAAASRYVIIYSGNDEVASRATHVRRRRFTDWTDRLGDWRLVEHVRNPYRDAEDPKRASRSDFYAFARGSAS